MALDLYVIIGIVLCVTQPVTIIANLLTIIAFKKVPSLQTHTSNLFIFALSIADFLSGIYQISYYGIPFAFSLKPPLGEIGCKMTVPFEYNFYTGNLLLVAISIDRVLLLSMDYSKYVKMTTKRRLKVAIGICVLIGQLGAAIELSIWDYATRHSTDIDFDEICLYPSFRVKWFSIYVSLCIYFLPLTLVAIFSIIFFKRLLIKIRTTRRVKPESHNQESSIETTGGNREEIALEENTRNISTRKRYIKPAVTLAALVSAMGISMVPYCTYIVVAGAGYPNPEVEYAMYLILQLNPFLDPLFFAATQKGVREYYATKIRGMLRSFCNQN